MNKKNLLIAIIFSLFLASCQDVIELEVPDGEVQLVVDGWLTDLEGEKQVLITTTSNYFDKAESPKVLNAFVLLKNENRVVDTLAEKSPGVYVTEHVGQIGAIYQLYIETAEGGIYESQPELLRPVPEIKAIYYEYKEKSAFEDAGYYVFIDTYEPAGTGDFYRWKQYVNGEYLNKPFDLLYASDEFVDGNPILAFEVGINPIEVGDHFAVEQLSISEAAYNFLFQLQQQTAFTGSLFDTPPAALEGNIKRIDEPDKKALGFFGVSAVSVKEVVIE